MNPIGRHNKSPENMRVLLTSIIGRPISRFETDPQVGRVHARVVALELTASEFAAKRGQEINNDMDFERSLIDLRNAIKAAPSSSNTLSPRERVGLAKLFDGHLHVGNFGHLGLEEVADESYQPLISMMLCTTEGRQKTTSQWAREPVVMERLNLLVTTIDQYLHVGAKFAN